MPLPKVKKNEAQAEFVSRCMASSVAQNDFTNDKQRLAVCYSQYKQAKKKQQIQGSLEEPNWTETEREIIDTGIILSE